MFSLARARKLLQGKHRRAEGLFLAEGLHVVRDALDAAAPLAALFVSRDASGDDEVLDLLGRAHEVGAWVQEVEPKELASIADTTTPQGVVAVARTRVCEEPDFGSPDGSPHGSADAPGGLWLLLDGVQDPGNVGTLLRAAEAFGARGVLALKGTADLWSGKVVRAAQGGHFRLDLWSEKGAADGDAGALLARIAAAGGEIWATARDGDDLYATGPAPRTCVVAVGNEARGVSDAVRAAAARTVAVPQRGRSDSLNVAMATSVVLSWLARPDGAS